MRIRYGILTLWLLVTLCGQEPPQEIAVSTAEAVEPEQRVIESVAVNLVNQSWFVDRVGTAVIYFDTEVEPLDTLPRGFKGLSFLDIEVQALPGSERGKSAAVLRFVLRETGLVTLPSIDFSAGERIYRTIPTQILVAEAVPTQAMAIALMPQKRRIYVGEPLRMDFVWRCDFDAHRLQALNYYPAFFNDASIEVVIPRNTSNEERQVGLPIGGRRVIADRAISADNASALGTIELPLFLRWNKPGNYTIPATRLECARLFEAKRNFGQYAAHFNNELFAAEDPRLRYERFYVESEPIEIEVLPLPAAGQLSEFSDLFTPVQFEVSVRPDVVAVGDLMEVEIKVFSEAPHAMIELAQLSRQRSLRGRFLVDDQVSRLWRADGSTFRARVRALTADVAAFPSLRFQVFDAEQGSYRMRVTEPVALEVNPIEGRSFMDLSAYAGTRVSLVEESEGIWHNLKSTVMNDVLNKLVVTLADAFWLLILLCALGFVVLLPLVRERRRRALDARHRARVEAFSAFQKLPDESPEKWQAFLRYLAVSFDAGADTWTVSDSVSALRSLGASSQEIEQMVAWHCVADAAAFHPNHPQAARGDLNSFGKRVRHLIGKSALMLLLTAFAMPSETQAQTWDQAEQLFERALGAQEGSEAAYVLYAESALKFQASAAAGERTGLAWYNAGNAWFRTGALGRAIAAYRQAQIYRPFDPLVRDNLQAARALTLNEISADNKDWLHIPGVWLKALLVCLSVVFVCCCLLQVRYRKRGILLLTLVVGLAGICVLGLYLRSLLFSGREGVLIEGEAIARKGPDYSYARAFGQPLYDGLEFDLIEARGDWSLIQLADGRECWIPTTQAYFIR